MSVSEEGSPDEISRDYSEYGDDQDSDSSSDNENTEEGDVLSVKSASRRSSASSFKRLTLLEGIDTPITETPITETPITETPITTAPITETPITEIQSLIEQKPNKPVLTRTSFQAAFNRRRRLFYRVYRRLVDAISYLVTVIQQLFTIHDTPIGRPRRLIFSRNSEDNTTAEIRVVGDSFHWRSDNQSVVLKRNPKQCTVFEIQHGTEAVEKKEEKPPIPSVKETVPLGTTVYRQSARAICIGHDQVSGSVKIVLDYTNKLAYVQIVSEKSEVYATYNINDITFLTTYTALGVAWLGDVRTQDKVEVSLEKGQPKIEIGDVPTPDEMEMNQKKSKPKIEIGEVPTQDKVEVNLTKSKPNIENSSERNRAGSISESTSKSVSFTGLNKSVVFSKTQPVSQLNANRSRNSSFQDSQSSSSGSLTGVLKYPGVEVRNDKETEETNEKELPQETSIDVVHVVFGSKYQCQRFKTIVETLKSSLRGGTNIFQGPDHSSFYPSDVCAVTDRWSNVSTYHGFYTIPSYIKLPKPQDDQKHGQEPMERAGMIQSKMEPMMQQQNGRASVSQDSKQPDLQKRSSRITNITQPGSPQSSSSQSSSPLAGSLQSDSSQQCSPQSELMMPGSTSAGSARKRSMRQQPTIPGPTPLETTVLESVRRESAMPGYKIPDSTRPETTGPEFTIRGSTMPGYSMLGCTLPGVTMPGYSMLGCTLPGVTMPGYSMLGCTIPGFTMPGFAIPGASIPEFTMLGSPIQGSVIQGSTMPDCSMPNFTMPCSTRSGLIHSRSPQPNSRFQDYSMAPVDNNLQDPPIAPVSTCLNPYFSQEQCQTSWRKPTVLNFGHKLPVKHRIHRTINPLSIRKSWSKSHPTACSRHQINR